MSTRYEREGKELRGEMSLVVTGNGHNGHHRSNGGNESFSRLEDGSILIVLTPTMYLKVNRRNRKVLRGQVFEKDQKTENYLSIGKFNLEREME